MSYVLRRSCRISVERIRIPLDRGSEGLSGLRIALLTDFHGRAVGTSSTEYADIVAFAPDIVCLGGDYVSSRPAQATALGPMLQGLSSLAPVYAVSGNHDHLAGWPEVAAFLEQRGAQVLSNRNVLLDHKGAPFWLVGVDDPASGHADLTEALPPGKGIPILCLAHSPSWFARGANPLPDEVILVLAGHTHGGQIKLPIIGAVTNAMGVLFPRRLVEGLSREGHSWLYINRGVGYTRIPVRFMAQAEITLITMQDFSATEHSH